MKKLAADYHLLKEGALEPFPDEAQIFEHAAPPLSPFIPPSLPPSLPLFASSLLP